MEMVMGFMALIRDAKEASRRLVPRSWQPMDTKYPSTPMTRKYFQCPFFTGFRQPVALLMIKRQDTDTI